MNNIIYLIAGIGMIGISIFAAASMINESTSMRTPNATVVKIYDGKCINLQEVEIQCVNNKHEIQLQEPICLIKVDDGRELGYKCGLPEGSRVPQHTDEETDKKIGNFITYLFTFSFTFVTGVFLVYQWLKE